MKKIINGIPMYEDKLERAQETLKIINSGQYDIICKHNVDIKHEIDTCVENTKLYEPDDELDISSIEKNSKICDFQVTHESTLQAAKRIHIDQGIEAVVALNFASAIKPGGGWLNGREAQEECITRQSALYLTLKATQCSDFYSENETLLDTYDPEAHFYTNYMIYSPNVPVIRDALSEELINPYYISFITSPATNLKKFKESYHQKIFQVIRHEHLSEKKKKKLESEQRESQEINENNNNNLKEETEQPNQEKDQENQEKDEPNQEKDELPELTQSNNSYQYEPFEYSESYGPDYDLSEDEYDKIEAETNECVEKEIKRNYDIMYQRCERILKICILNKNQAVILGAFGCGVFGNNPSEISNIFYHLLVEEKYGYYFKVVVFAILGKPKGYSISCFKNKFSTISNSNESQSTAEDHNRNITKLQSTSKDHNRNITELQSTAGSKDLEIDELNDTVKRLKFTIESKDREIESLKYTNNELKSKDESKDKEIEELHELIVELQSKAEGKDKEIKSLNDKIAELQSKAEDKDKKIKLLNDKIAELQPTDEPKD